MNPAGDIKVLQLVSSGGSAHLNAGKILTTKHAQEGKSVKTINVMESKCTFFARLGKFLIGFWDRAQAKGDVQRQINIISLQWISNKLFSLPTYLHILGQLQKNEQIDTVELTCPLFLKAICNAVLEHNRKTSKNLKVDLYMVEPPTEEACYYLHELATLDAKQTGLITLHAAETKNENYWKDVLGLESEQVIIDPPVDPDYLNLDIHPGMETSLTLKSMSDTDKTFFDGLCQKHSELVTSVNEEYTFNILSEDRVGLIMLGGVPTKSAILSYVKEAIEVAKKQTARDHKNILFVACGKKELKLFDEVTKLLEEKQDSLIIVPFIGQPVKTIFARADFSVTRSGAMTSQEIIQMKKQQGNNKPKFTYIHSQIPKFVASQDKKEIAHRALALKIEHNPNAEKDPQAAYQEYLIKRGIPLWEGANAEFIIKEHKGGADVMKPDHFASALEQRFFEKDAPGNIQLDKQLLEERKKDIAKAKWIRTAKTVGMVALAVLAASAIALISVASFGTLPTAVASISLISAISSMSVAAVGVSIATLSVLSLASLSRFRSLKKKKVWDWELAEL